MIKERDGKINGFMDVVRDLEKERTDLVQSCYKQHMLYIKRLPGDSYERLYEKYLKVYLENAFFGGRKGVNIRVGA